MTIAKTTTIRTMKSITMKVRSYIFVDTSAAPKHGLFPAKDATVGIGVVGKGPEKLPFVEGERVNSIVVALALQTLLPPNLPHHGNNVRPEVANLSREPSYQAEYQYTVMNTQS